MGAPTSASPAAGGVETVVAVGVRSFPYLADHGVHDMVVVPGAFFIDLALSIHRERFGAGPTSVHNVVFHHPVILSNDDSHLTVNVTDHRAFVEYSFVEQTVVESSSAVPRKAAAQLEVHAVDWTSHEMRSAPRFVATLPATTRIVIDGKAFYQALRANGNRYGHAFQHLTSIERDGDRVLAELAVPPTSLADERRSCRPLLLDLAIQALSAFTLEEGRPFVLRSIRRVKIPSLDYPDRLSAHATRLSDRSGSSGEWLGDVRMVDAEGRAVVEIDGVRLTLLPRTEVPATAPSPKLCVAATFTADPLADSLQFWADQFRTPLDLAFLPYNQVFQQLLDPGSAFHGNASGANVILLTLDRWAEHRLPAMRLIEGSAERCFGDRTRHRLPNGLDIVHLNRYETEHVYREIFEDRCYIRHGIRLPDEATVVDIGANIGLFSLFVFSQCASPRVIAFEPSPIAYDLLRANCEAYGLDVRAFNLGVAARAGTAAFTVYENSSVFSGFHADLAEDRESIHAVVRNALNRQISLAPEEVDTYVAELAAERLHSTTITCGVTSLSDIIRDHNLTTIDLLKIDAEKSELDILAGIDENDWPKIQQLVIEVHDRTGERVSQVERLLIARGYVCAVDQEPALEQSGLFTIAAIRSGQEGHDGPDLQRDRDARYTRNLDRHVNELRDAVGSFMARSPVPLILCFCPASAAGRINPSLRAALDAAEERLANAVAQVPQVHTIRSASLIARYALEQYFDRHSHRLGDIPYTAEGYAAIGTALSRVMFNLRSNPYKVIVLDCDNTLWKGICGEDGPSGIEIAAPYKALQEFMLRQAGAGRLLCLCSKNNEPEVLEVFRQRSDMPLKEEHFVSRRVNWQRKSENLQSLARELNLGLESFIFVDDNPVECAQVEAACPEVLTLRLPQNADAIPAFLDNIWAFDTARPTEDDRHRTEMYPAEHRATAEPEPTVAERLHHWARAPGRDWRGDSGRSQSRLAVDVQDEPVQFHHDQALRNRRAGLSGGRPGERLRGSSVRSVRRVWARRRRALRAQRRSLHCRYVAPELSRPRQGGRARCRRRARPARRGRRQADGGIPLRANGKERTGHRIPSKHGAPASGCVSRVVVLLGRRPRTTQVPDGCSSARAAITARQFCRRCLISGEDFPPDHLSARMQRLGTDLCCIGNIAEAIEKHRFRASEPQSASVAAGSTLEAALVNIWRRALGRTGIGANDNFFDAGGTSLSAVQVIAAIKKELKHDLSIVNLFEYPTVTLLANHLTSPSKTKAEDSGSQGAALRGQQRRYSAVRRKTS